MKRILFMTWILSIMANAFCQTAVYDTPYENNVVYTDCNDTIMESHFYRLNVEDDGFVLESHLGVKYNYAAKYNRTDTLLVSFGRCWLHGDELIMKDSLNGYFMKAVFDNKGGLRFKQGLCFTLEKTFCQQPWNGIKVKSQLAKYDLSMIDFEQFRSQKVAKKLKMGCYGAGYDKIINLMGNGEYVYYNVYPKDTLSKGHWTQEGDLLVFMDYGLTEPFYAGIEEEKQQIIRGNAMPGAFSATKYGKEYDDSYLYIGYDDIGPSKSDLEKPWMGDDYINARFKGQFEENCFCELYFYDNEYSIEQIQYFDDVIPVLTLSYGRYTKEGNMLYLNDSLNRCQIAVELSSDTSKMTILRGYCSWIGKDFDFQDKTWHRPEFVYFFDFDEVCYSFDNYRNQTLIPIPFGNYHFNINSFSYDLEFEESNLFVFKAMDVVYLQGNFEREGNLLILKDDCIEESFYVLINEESFVAYLPGLFGKVMSVISNRF